MKIEVLGPRASGKTTICKKISDEFKVNYVSLGQLSRKEMNSETPLGKKMKYYVDNGIPYPDGFLVDFIQSHLQQALERTGGFILDGYPRKRSEALELVQILNELMVALDACIELEASVDELVKRTKHRFCCPSCDNQVSIPDLGNLLPFCPRCGTTMGIRSDDTVKEIKRMHELYLRESNEIKAILSAHVSLKLLTIDADGELSFITQSTLFFLRSLANNNLTA
jgi:adenylate kinase